MDRNFILALVLSGLILFGYEFMVAGPKREAFQRQQAELGLNAPQTMDPADEGQTFLPGSVEEKTRDEALAETPDRLRVDTPELVGSINLRGLVFDDLTLKNYRASVDDDSPRITLLSPQSTPYSQFMRAGVRINGENDARDVWTAPEGAVLTPSTPVTLTRSEGGIEQTVTISVDDRFMFTVNHSITNRTEDEIGVRPVAGAFQRGVPQDLQNMMILFEGPIATVADRTFEVKYKKLLKGEGAEEQGVGGWVGITDKFWLTAVIPPQSAPMKATLSSSGVGTPVFAANYVMDRTTVAPGQVFTTETNLFAGAKRVEILREYESALAIDRFVWAVDWGNFHFLTRPIFATLSFFHGIVGNWGVAILLLTLVVKAILYPLANMSYKSLAGMKKVQPEMAKLRERYKDDQQKQQQELMALYKKHKINPAAGCLPMLAQMPIFYALYKVLFVTIELRHEPFLYIKDLSERDPTSIFNLFGLLPFEPTAVPVIGTFLGIGILPLLMGAAMYVQTKLNPPAPDPMQARIFALMPLIFMFIFAPFAAGLVLYWFWNTFLSVLQQYVIMKRNGADVDILGNIKAGLRRKPAAANENKAS